jgi:hypothetical protein
MAAPTTWTIVRDILSADLTLTADEVIARARARGVKAPEADVRTTVHTVRKRIKKKMGQPAKVAPAAARQTAGAAPAVAPVPGPAAAPAPAPAAVVAPDGVSAVLSNVALVNGVVAACGGVEQARQVAEAVRACGGADLFAQYLDLVSGIRTAGV